jgi:hypothetical protein
MVDRRITLTAVSGDVFPALQSERPFMFTQAKGTQEGDSPGRAEALGRSMAYFDWMSGEAVG